MWITFCMCYNVKMAKLFGLDILPEFEILFKKLLALPLFGDTQTAITKPPKQIYYKRIDTRGRSDFIIFAPIYNPLSSARHIAWTAYWGTLPFGSHSGAGGWPGSGFSAFVYVNAPRYKNGDDLLLDPPGVLGPELCTNPDFEFNADSWALDGMEWVSGSLRALVDSDEYIGNATQDFGGNLDSGMYRVQVTVTIPEGVSGNLSGGFFSGYPIVGAGIGTDFGTNFYIGVQVTEALGVSMLYSMDVDYENDPADNGFAIFVDGYPDLGDLLIESVSLKKIL